MLSLITSHPLAATIVTAVSLLLGVGATGALVLKLTIEQPVAVTVVQPPVDDSLPPKWMETQRSRANAMIHRDDAARKRLLQGR